MATNGLELESASCAVNRWLCVHKLADVESTWQKAVEISTEQIRHGAFGGARRTSLLECPLHLFSSILREAKAVMPLPGHLKTELNKLCCQLKRSFLTQQAPLFSALTCSCQLHFFCQSGCYLTFTADTDKDKDSPHLLTCPFGCAEATQVAISPC